MEGRRRRKSVLSASLPDVSLSACHQHQQQQQPVRNLSPLSDTPILPSPTFSPSTQHNYDDDLWAETADPNTGSVFYVTPNVSPSVAIPSSSSSSSLSSSNLSIADTGVTSPVSNRLSSSLQVARDHEELLGSSRGFHRRQVSLSSRMRLPLVGQKMKDMKQMLKKQELATSSMCDLKQRQGKHFLSMSSHSSSDVSQIPHGAQFGSMGTYLQANSSPFIGHKFKVELDLSRLHHHFVGSEVSEVDGGSCSLDALGVVPAMDNRKVFRSTLSLHMPSPKSDKKSQQQKLLQSSPTRGSTHQPVIIKKLRSGGVAAGTALNPGDTILAVNGHFVNMESVDSVLATLTSCKTLELLVKKGHTHTPHSHSPATGASSSSAILSPPQTPSLGGLVRLVSGGRGAGGALRPRQFRRPHRHPHLLLYVTLDTKEDDPADEDILFCYPSREVRQDGGGSVGDLEVNEDMEGGGGRRKKRMEEKLMKLRGAFLTLSDSLVTITEHKSCTNSAVILEGQLFFLSFSQYNKEMLLIVLPAYLVSQYQLQLLLENIERMMILLHGSVHNAMTVNSHALSVEHLIGLMLDAILSDEPLTPGPSTPLLGVPSIPRLKLPTNVTLKLHAILSGLESGGHGNQPVMEQVCRPFLILGSCLLNRGALACSHLPPAQLREVTLFLHAYRLIELTAAENTSQIVIWQEVFLSSDNTEQDEEEKLLGTDLDGCRLFLLVVGLDQMLLCMLMQDMLPPPPGHAQFRHTPSVDAMYVDRGRALLVQLKAQDLFLQDFEEISSLPSVQMADSALSPISSKLTAQVKRSSSHRSSPLISHRKKNSDPLGLRNLSTNRSFSVRNSKNESDSEEDDRNSKHSSSPRRSHSMLHQRRTFRKRKSSTGLQPHMVPPGFQDSQRTQHNVNSLAVGLDDFLLHYICLESGCGLMLCPTHSTPSGTVHTELLLSFQSAASRVREVLLGRSRSREITDEEDDDDDGIGYDDDDDDDDNGEELESVGFGKSSKALASASPFVPQQSNVVEHGILLEYNSMSNLKVRSFLRYWVIGRLFVEEKRELYLCCQESASHNTIEMAFKLLFGWPG